MSIVGLVLVALGVAAIAVGALRVRGPWATYRRLQATEANLARYDAWRGNSRAPDDAGPTGADVMKEYMRRRLLAWTGLIVLGAMLLLVGWAVG